MAKYRKKPLPVDAVQWFPGNEIPAGAEVLEDSLGPALKTFEGWVNLRPGSWIVGPGAAGEFWPVDDGVFKATYERVHESIREIAKRLGIEPKERADAQAEIDRITGKRMGLEDDGPGCPPGCGGCSCHSMPPCSHCVEHSKETDA